MTDPTPEAALEGDDVLAEASGGVISRYPFAGHDNGCECDVCIP